MAGRKEIDEAREWHETAALGFAKMEQLVIMELGTRTSFHAFVANAYAGPDKYAANCARDGEAARQPMMPSGRMSHTMPGVAP
jgi:hypothetical protein